MIKETMHTSEQKRQKLDAIDHIFKQMIDKYRTGKYDSIANFDEFCNDLDNIQSLVKEYKSG